MHFPFRHEQQTISYYDRHGADWAAQHDTLGFWHDEMLTFRELLPTGRIIDVGCGAGRDTAELNELGYSCLGVDASSTMINLAQSRRPDIEFQQTNLFELDQLSRIFDGFWCAAVLLHIIEYNLPAALSQIRSVTKKGGFGFIAVRSGGGVSTDSLGEESRHFQYWRRSDFSFCLARAGMQTVQYALREVDHTAWHCFHLRMV